MSEIAYQNKDIASKLVGEALIGKNLEPFGLPHLRIVGVLPTNLPAIESNELRLDHLFLLSDGSLGIIDYESEYRRENFVKYLNYIARVIKRYAGQGQLEELRQVKMIVIYTADVEHAESVYDLGGIVMTVEPAFLIHQETNKILRALEEKIGVGRTLTEEELMQLMILPLTVKGRQEKQDVIVKAVELARQIPDREQTVRALAGILTFTDKVIDEAYKKRIKEEMVMTQIGQMLMEEGYERGVSQGLRQGISQGIRQGISQGISRGTEEKAKSTAHNMFNRGFSAEDTAGLVEVELETVKSWYALWSENK